MSWNIYQDRTFNQIYPFDCANSIGTTCYKTNFDKCLSICQSSPRCQYGFFKKDGTCFPLNTDNYEDLNPYDYVMDKTPGEFVPEDKVFINNKTYSQEPSSNTVRYFDTVYLRNVETGLYMQVGNEEDLFVKFAPFESELTLEYKNINTPRNKVKYGDDLTFGVPNHPLILTRGLSKPGYSPTYGNVSWNNLTPFSLLQISLFKFENIDDPRDTSFLDYEEKFYINILGSYLTVDGNLNALVRYESPQKLKQNGANFTFELIPSKTVLGYYCNDNNKCTSVPLYDTSIVRNDRFYNNKEVMRTESCYFKCNL